MLTVSEEACQALKGIMAERNLDSPVRVFAQQSCGGAQLILGVDEARDTDHKLEQDGLVFVIDKDLAEQTGAVSLNYVADASQPGFAINSEKPLVMGDSCGCGCSSCG
jgi:Fe-S cluster assembly iron-binding protein IscA